MLSVIYLIKRLTIFSFISTLLLTHWVLADSGAKCLHLFAKQVPTIFQNKNKSVFAYLIESVNSNGGGDHKPIEVTFKRAYRSQIRTEDPRYFPGIKSDPQFVFPTQEVRWIIPNSIGFKPENVEIQQAERSSHIYDLEIWREKNEYQYLGYETRYVLQLHTETNLSRFRYPDFNIKGKSYVLVHNKQLQLHLDVHTKIDKSGKVLEGDRTSLSLSTTTFTGFTRISLNINKYAIINHTIMNNNEKYHFKTELKFEAPLEEIDIRTEATSLNEFIIYTYNFKTRMIKEVRYEINDEFNTVTQVSTNNLGIPENLPLEIRNKLFAEVTEVYAVNTIRD